MCILSVDDAHTTKSILIKLLVALFSSCSQDGILRFQGNHCKIKVNSIVYVHLVSWL